jgi:transposase-like protein
MKKRSQYSAAFKLKAVLMLLKEEKTAAEIASELEIHPTMLHAWHREFLEKSVGIFTDKRKRKDEQDPEKLNEHLYKQIGQLKVENDFLVQACAKLNLKSGKGR